MKCLRVILFALALLAACAPLTDQPTASLDETAPLAIKKPALALVLGGGGVKGLAHLGVIAVLEQAGIRPDLIVGTSAGSIVGALYADSQQISQVKSWVFDAKWHQFFGMKVMGLPTQVLLLIL